MKKTGNQKENIASKNVIVLFGDPSQPDITKPSGIFDEDDFYTIDLLKKSLFEIGQKDSINFHFLLDHKTLIQDLVKYKEKLKIDFIFNLCDEGFNNDPTLELNVPALLELLKLHYSGCSPQCIAYCFDKVLVRSLAKEMGITVPSTFTVNPDDKTFEVPINFPVFVKPNFSDAGFGITQHSVAYNKEEYINAISVIRSKFSYNNIILVEEFLTGKDLTFGIIGNPPDDYTALPIIEEDYSVLPENLPKICGYEAKWLQDSPYWNLRSIRADIPEETKKIIEESSIKLFKRLDCRDYSRFDWRLNAEGIPKLLEANPNPGWCWDGHLAKMAKIAGISYTEMINLILKATENRINKHI